MMRVALHSELRPGAVDGYVAAHAWIPADLADSFERLGIHDWVIWRSGHRLFHLVECDDWDAALAGLAGDPAEQRWQAVIAGYVELYRDADGAERFAPLAQVWSLKDQRERS